MGKLYLEVVTPNQVLVSREVDSVVMPGTEGQFGVLPEHVAFLSGIVPGEMRYSIGSEQGVLAVTRGFAEISDDNVSVLVDAAEKAEHIDVKRAQEALERAKQRLARERAAEDVDFARAEASMHRATARIRVAEKAS